MLALFSQTTRLLAGLAALVAGVSASGQTSFPPLAGESPLTGALAGDQVFPSVAIGATGGYVVWQDNVTDGDGWGISALRLDANLSGSQAPFRVNQVGAGNQENPRVALLSGGGAVCVWQGGLPGGQKIFARFLAADGTFSTADQMVNTYTNSEQINPNVAVLTDGTVVIVWASAGQDGSLQGVYGQRLSATGAKLGAEFAVNQTTRLNQRTPNVTALANGGFVVAWISEVSVGLDANSVDSFALNAMARTYSASGTAAGNEFKLNSANNACANPSLSALPTGGFTAVWSQRDAVNFNNGWDIYTRSFGADGTAGVAEVCVNTFVYGDQYLPRIQNVGVDRMIVWTSLAQDGSREGVYGRLLDAAGQPSGSEFRVNTTTVGQQMHPTIGSDGSSRFLVVWTSYAGDSRFDLFAQRYAISESLPQLPAPVVTALSQSRIAVSWPELAGYEVSTYGLYVDGSPSPVAVSSNYFVITGLGAGSTHTVRLDYLLRDGRRPAPSVAASVKTWGEDANFDGLPDDWQARYWGNDPAKWPAASEDSDGDGVSNLMEFLAGTDPTNARSVLRTRVADSGQGWRVHWDAQPGLVYLVQSSPDLANWTNVGVARFAAGTNDSLLINPAAGRSFYRIVRVR